MAWVIVWLGAIIQGPMMFFQFIMACLCYMFLPIAVSLFAFDGTKGIATRYIQQTLAILAWPIGFATVDLVGNALLNSVATAVAAGGAVAVRTATEWGPASFLIAGFVAVWLILGSLATPIVMQALFCSGSPMSSVVGHAIQYGMGAAGLARFAGGGSPPAPSSDSKGSNGGSSSTPASPAPSGGGGGGGSASAPAYTPTSPLPPLIGPVPAGRFDRSGRTTGPCRTTATCRLTGFGNVLRLGRKCHATTVNGRSRFTSTRTHSISTCAPWSSTWPAIPAARSTPRA